MRLCTPTPFFPCTPTPCHSHTHTPVHARSPSPTTIPKRSPSPARRAPAHAAQALRRVQRPGRGLLPALRHRRHRFCQRSLPRALAAAGAGPARRVRPGPPGLRVALAAVQPPCLDGLQVVAQQVDAQDGLRAGVLRACVLCACVKVVTRFCVERGIEVPAAAHKSSEQMANQRPISKRGEEQHTL